MSVHEQMKSLNDAKDNNIKDSQANFDSLSKKLRARDFDLMSVRKQLTKAVATKFGILTEEKSIEAKLEQNKNKELKIIKSDKMFELY